VARALINKPALVLADEPTGNLDSRSGSTILELLRRTCSELGATIVMVTHDAHAASYADRVVFLKDGATVRALLLGDRSLAVQMIDDVMASLEAAPLAAGSAMP
jgi:putative ABC transport system ATP-binding protein